MKKSLLKKTEEWMKLERRTLEQRKKAEEYYEQELMTYITAEYLRHNKQILTEKSYSSKTWKSIMFPLKKWTSLRKFTVC